MNLVKIFIISILLNSMLQAASMKDTVLLGAAGSDICKVYAYDVGGNEELFIELNVLVMKIAEKMGYTDDLESYISDVSSFKVLLQQQLVKQYGSKLNVYNNWCIQFYNGFQNGLAKANK